ncbi:MAG: glycerophosphodiester phosphodiesterase [Lachnospiraceae bacterium]|nr:glycerophosphodiester phosphodiesterase [Lachnospiraceae bacterium]MCI7189542.1 glycerophosphodiester phosphodiesterase [Lachnospiraceae bacterium]MDD7627907.1 glycerophosphodiester phosphodiesterase family protein [Lachnospiraceae bacterium]MDY4119688.1 glycerophosphodiester phosphodiesterase family protein [Lachnospiraceae bacterium]
MTALYVVLIVILVLIVLYFLAIKPRLSRQKQWAPFKGVYYAHRGLHDNESEAPENSLPAFKKAVKAGYGIELDVQLTKDRVPVVFHDFTLERACGKPGKVYEYTYEELQQFPLFQSNERIPKFEEILKAVDGKVPLIVEIKLEWMDLTVCAFVDKLLKEYKGMYCIESFNPLVLTWYRRYHNDVLRGQLSDAFLKEGEYRGVLYWILQNLLLNWMTKPDFVAYNHKYADNLSRRLCRKLYKNMAAAWTIKSQQELEAAKEEFDVFIFDSFIPKKQK